jgi:hypothetical protein
MGCATPLFVSLLQSNAGVLPLLTNAMFFFLRSRAFLSLLLVCFSFSDGQRYKKGF